VRGDTEAHTPRRIPAAGAEGDKGSNRDLGREPQTPASSRLPAIRRGQGHSARSEAHAEERRGSNAQTRQGSAAREAVGIERDFGRHPSHPNARRDAGAAGPPGRRGLPLQSKREPLDPGVKENGTPARLPHPERLRHLAQNGRPDPGPLSLDPRRPPTPGQDGAIRRETGCLVQRCVAAFGAHAARIRGVGVEDVERGVQRHRSEGLGRAPAKIERCARGDGNDERRDKAGRGAGYRPHGVRSAATATQRAVRLGPRPSEGAASAAIT